MHEQTVRRRAVPMARIGRDDCGVTGSQLLDLLAFQLHALVQEANLRRSLLDDDGAFDDARALLARVLSDVQPAPDTQGDER